MNDDPDLDRRLDRLRTFAEPAPWKEMETRLRAEGLIATRRTRTPNVYRHVFIAALYVAVGVVAGVKIAGTPAATKRPDVADGMGGDSSSVMRLAALQAIVLTTAQALREAPGDSLIAQYHVAARAQRDALLDRVASAAGAGPRWY